MNKFELSFDRAIPVGEASQFNTAEVLSSGQERFIAYLEKVNLRTLISCIEECGTKIKGIKELSLPDRKSLILLKEQEKNVLSVNPRLYFLSKDKAGSLAVKELLKRFNSLGDRIMDEWFTSLLLIKTVFTKKCGINNSCSQNSYVGKMRNKLV